jgi:hypothetical protein
MARLKSKPLRRHPLPAYPTKLQALADPDLLAKHLPPAWLSRAEIAGTVGVFLAANVAGCSPHSPSPGQSGSGATGTKAAIVAPIFDHGEGYAYDGCVVVARPVFLSEEEAISAINEELALSGLNLPERHIEVPSVAIRGVKYEQRYDWIAGKPGAELVTVAGPLDLDLRDPNKKIGITYVSQDECLRLGLNRPDRFGSDLRSAAANVAESVRRQGPDMCFAVFYDPVTTHASPGMRRYFKEDPSSKTPPPFEELDAAKLESKRLLRLQVKDFVDWLKGQGMI